MVWHQSKIILVSLAVIITGCAFLIFVAPPLPIEEREFIRQVEDYQRATARLEDDMAGSPWTGNSTMLELYGRREKALADLYTWNVTLSPVSGIFFESRMEVLKALGYEKASAEDLISASTAFREGKEAEGLALMESASERQKMRSGHLDRAGMLIREAVIFNQLQYVPKG